MAHAAKPGDLRPRWDLHLQFLDMLTVHHSTPLVGVLLSLIFLKPLRDSSPLFLGYVSHASVTCCYVNARQTDNDDADGRSSIFILIVITLPLLDHSHDHADSVFLFIHN